MQQQHCPKYRGETSQTVGHQIAKLFDGDRGGNIKATKLNQLTAKLVFGLVSQVSVRKLDELKRVMAKEYNARICPI